MEDRFGHFVTSPASDQSSSQVYDSLGLSLSPPFQEDIQIRPTIFSNSVSLQSNATSSSPDESYKSHSKQQPFEISKCLAYNDSSSNFRYVVRTQQDKDLLQIAAKTKIVQKRDKAKQKMKANKELSRLMTTAAKKYIPPALEDPNLDEKTKRKLVQVLKNRVASQKTRDRRKMYISELEEVKSRLEEENSILNLKNTYLEERLRAMEEAEIMLKAENEELKRKQIAEVHIDDPYQFLHLESKQGFAEQNGENKMPINTDDNEELPMLSRGSSQNKSSFTFLFIMTTIIAALLKENRYPIHNIHKEKIFVVNNNGKDNDLDLSSTTLMMIQPSVYLYRDFYKTASFAISFDYNIQHAQYMRSMSAPELLKRRDLVMYTTRDSYGIEGVSMNMWYKHSAVNALYSGISQTNQFFSLPQPQPQSHLYHYIGKHFNCSTMMYNHIPGSGIISKKRYSYDKIEEVSMNIWHKNSVVNSLYYDISQAIQFLGFFKPSIEKVHYMRFIFNSYVPEANN